MPATGLRAAWLTNKPTADIVGNVRVVILVSLVCHGLAAQAVDHWTAARDSHFEVYSQSGAESARRALNSFEQLRTFFAENDLLGRNTAGKRAVRVVGFRSEREYKEYRPRPIADAYYVADGTQDYMVMAALPPSAFSIAAHEYTHYVAHTIGWKLAACLNEGLAEYFSSLRVSERGFEVGGDLPARSQVLRRSNWLPLAELFGLTIESAMPETRKFAAIFYAESWLLTDMLINSFDYFADFRELLTEFDGGANAAQAFRKVYGKPLGVVTKDLRDWLGSPRIRHFTPNARGEWETVETHELSSVEESFLMAQVSLISGHVAEAKAGYERLLLDMPDDAELHAALGRIAAKQGNKDENLRQWREAVRDRSKDAELCYRYALLAEEAGSGAQEVRAALKRVLELAPVFDDARYKLALLENQAGEYQLAVEQLRAMRVPVGERRFAYWIAMASALNELDEREGAKEAAHEAEAAAQTEDQRIEARQIAFLASTDLKVQFVTDSDGRNRMSTTRVEHGATDFNPFVEPSDQIRRVRGKLSEVLCEKGKLTGFLLRTSEGAVIVEVPDPLHVLIRNGPGEFYCGPVDGRAVGTE